MTLIALTGLHSKYMKTITLSMEVMVMPLSPLPMLSSHSDILESYKQVFLHSIRLIDRS